MKSLAAIQWAVQSNILSGNDFALAYVASTRGVSAATRLGIYRDGYYLRLTEALATTYAALHGLLGESQFATLARRYIDAHPSQHYSVRYFGHRLAAFVGKEEPYRSTPVLEDLARWEWAMADVFDAADADTVTAAELQSVTPKRWPQLRFRFHTAIRLVSSRWNVAEVWAALNEGQSPPQPSRSAQRHRWAIWRQALKVYFAPLDVAEEAAFRSALRGESFAQLCARAPAGLCEQAQVAQWAAGLLQQWINRAWIVDLETVRC
jgi:hypothetical protein